MKNTFNKIPELSEEKNREAKYLRNFMKLVSIKDLTRLLRDIDPFYNDNYALLSMAHLKQEKDLFEYLVDSPEITKEKTLDIVKSCLHKYDANNEIYNWSKEPTRRLLKAIEDFTPENQ